MHVRDGKPESRFPLGIGNQRHPAAWKRPERGHFHLVVDMTTTIVNPANRPTVVVLGDPSSLRLTMIGCPRRWTEPLVVTPSPRLGTRRAASRRRYLCLPSAVALITCGAVARVAAHFRNARRLVLAADIRHSPCGKVVANAAVSLPRTALKGNQTWVRRRRRRPDGGRVYSARLARQLAEQQNGRVGKAIPLWREES